MNLDPITTEVVSNRLREVAATMEHALYHTGYSPILRESHDGTAGLTDADGRVVVVSGGLQYHSVPYYHAVQSMLKRFGEAMREGDSFIVNDPYRGGNPHVPDVVAVTPVFVGGRIIAFTVSVAHKSDLGGIVPGSSGAAAREIYHDGLLLPPVRYQTAEGISDMIEDIIRSNSRVPDVVIGDLRGQVGCTRLGALRLKALCEEYGVETVCATMAEAIGLTGKRLRRELATWEDGSAEAEGLLDHDGADTDKPVRVHVRATKRGDKLVLDFSASGPQTRGPVNVCAPTTQACALLAVIAATDPDIPMNAGLLDAVEFVMQSGTVVSPRHPATMNLYFPTAHLAYNCVLSALGKLHAARAVAPSGLGTGALAIGYAESRSGKRAVQYELMVTALGGTSSHDGASIVLPMNHFTPSTPVEILETEYPVMVRSYNIWRDSAGAGEFRGGMGYVREYELLSDCMLTARTSNHKFGAWGLRGGKGARTSHTYIERGGEREELGPLAQREVQAGGVLKLEQSGGAGYGDPLRRPVETVLEDVRNGYVSADAAREEYGVVIDAQTLCVDQAATAALRMRSTERSSPQSDRSNVKEKA